MQYGRGGKQVGSMLATNGFSGLFDGLGLTLAMMENKMMRKNIMVASTM